MAVDDTDGVQGFDEVCNHVGCVCDEPDRLVVRTLKGSDFSAVYCTRHDPLDDPEVSMMWEGPDDE